MKKLKYISLFALSIAIVSCDVNNELEEITAPVEAEVAVDANGVDFSNYVAVGASFTSGYTDGALFAAAQQNSFPNILASKFALDGGGSFNQPLMGDNIGGLLAGGTPIQPPRLIFNTTTGTPSRLNAAPTTDITSPVTGSFNNLGIPGAKSFHFVAAGYGNLAGVQPGLANPYFARMSTSASTTVLADALAQQSTFFTLSEVGGNDVLGFATSGGVGVDQTGNIDPTTYGSNDITDPNVFANVFSNMVTALTANGSKGVVATVPDITLLPFFTTVPNDALELDAETAASLTGFFQAVAGIFTQALIAQNVPPANAQALAAQYAITFSAGKNRWIIDVPVTQANPLGFRQMTENELLVLTIDQSALAQGYGSVALTPEVLQVLGKLQAGAQITAQEGQTVLAAVNGIDDKDALDTDELLSIKTATDSYNGTISAIATANDNVALIDLNAILNQAATTGIKFDSYTMTTDLVTGGLISLDGIHLTSRGYALMANKILEVIDDEFGTNFKVATNGMAKADDYPTNYSAALR